jgi:hypothetical protein
MIKLIRKIIILILFFFLINKNSNTKIKERENITENNPMIKDLKNIITNKFHYKCFFATTLILFLGNSIYLLKQIYNYKDFFSIKNFKKKFFSFIPIPIEVL